MPIGCLYVLFRQMSIHLLFPFLDAFIGCCRAFWVLCIPSNYSVQFGRVALNLLERTEILSQQFLANWSRSQRMQFCVGPGVLGITQGTLAVLKNASKSIPSNAWETIWCQSSNQSQLYARHAWITELSLWSHIISHSVGYLNVSLAFFCSVKPF